MRITKEMIEKNQKYFINVNNGGLSRNQIQKPNGSVLPNCTGLATGLFLMNIELETGEFREDIRNALIFDAENYYWQVTNPKGQLYGKLEYGKEPKPGSIMCFSGGNGHVCYVNEVINSNKVICFTSSYKGKVDYAEEIDTNNNGNWSYVKTLKFQGFIYPPIKKPQPAPPEPQPEEEFIEYKMQHGDRLWNLAIKFTGDSSNFEIIKKDSGIVDHYNIPDGTIIKIRKSLCK